MFISLFEHSQVAYQATFQRMATSRNIIWPEVYRSIHAMFSKKFTRKISREMFDEQCFATWPIPQTLLDEQVSNV